MHQQHLVTGAAGFIGSHLVDRLLAAGQDVLGVDKLSLGRRTNLASALANERFRLIVGDLNDPACLAELENIGRGRPIDVVWHLAANSDIAAGAASPDPDLQDTLLTTVQMLRLMRSLGIGRIVMASTSAIYGDLGRRLSEDTGPLLPISNYGAMKLASEAAISAALENHLQQVWICRFPNVVGPRATHGAIFDFVRKLRQNPAELIVLGDGRQTKPYIHVSELLDAMLFIQQRAGERMNYYNIGSASGATSVAFIAESVVKIVAPAATIRYTGGSKGWSGDVPRFDYASDKLTALGFRPQLSSDEAVLRAAAEIAREQAS